MERIGKQPSALLTSDWHLREDTPICRTDSYWNSMWKKVDFISNLQKKWNIPVLHGGDLFDKARPSLNLVRETMLHIPDEFYTVYGQHDLVNHSLDLTNKCGIDVLSVAKKLHVLGTISYCNDNNLVVDGFHWGQEPKDTVQAIEIFKQTSPLMKKILVWHQMVWQGKKPYPTCTDAPASSVIKKYPYDLLLFGDNHKTFVEQYEGRLLINPGSLMRMDADQIDHKPCVFLWYASDNTVQQVFLPIEEGVISREHLDVKEERDNRITAFVEKLSDNYSVSLSFEENLSEFMKVNNVEKSVREIIYKSIE
jgi:DNA repair exonuclease SbcCD nuclease subunit